MRKPAKSQAPRVAPGLAGFRLSASVETVPPHAAWRLRTAAAIDGLVVPALHAARRGAGMSQGELADRMGRRQSFVAKIEAFDRNVLVHELLLMCALLKLDPCELIALVMDSPTIRALIDTAPPYRKRVR